MLTTSRGTGKLSWRRRRRRHGGGGAGPLRRRVGPRLRVSSWRIDRTAGRRPTGAGGGRVTASAPTANRAAGRLTAADG